MGPSTLAQVLRGLPTFHDNQLLVGYETSDDAAVYQLTDDLAFIQTVDIFPPAVDDPYEYGQIAAANSLSDVWAMGGTPKLCLNILMFPDQLPFEIVTDILKGGYDKVAEAGAIIVGGHTIKDDIPKYGLCVSGLVHPHKILRNNTIQKGDALILTKPIGTGVLTNADRGGMLTPAEHQNMVACMAALNKYAAELALTFDGIHACTDVTGFSLLGHSYEMCSQTGLSIVITAASVPLLGNAKEYAAMGLVPAMAYQNMEHLKDKVFLSPGIPECVCDLLFDPQTSGGLLYSVASDQCDRLLEALKKVSESAAIIGYVDKMSEYPVLVV